MCFLDVGEDLAEDMVRDLPDFCPIVCPCHKCPGQHLLWGSVSSDSQTSKGAGFTCKLFQ